MLEEVRERTGGSEFTLETPASEIFEKRDPKRSSSPVFDWFLIALACLLPMDVAVRRIQIDFWAIKNLFSRKKSGPSTATMGTLLQRKQSVGAKMESARGESRKEAPKMPTASTIPRATGPVPSKKAPPAKPDPEPKKPAGSSGTTTSRLLDAKRKRQEEDG